MGTGMLGKVRCQHRWKPGPTLPIPRMPTLGPADFEEDSNLRIETAVCQRCYEARMRLATEEYHYSGWSHAERLSDLLLGRELNKHEKREIELRLVMN